MSGASKVACRWLDRLQNELNCSLQHIHYDQVSQSTVGNEFRPPEYPKYRVDGYSADTKTIYEFLGNHFHGHPDLYDASKPARDNLNFCNMRIDQLYQKTEKRLQQLHEAGYCIIYIWESEFKQYERQGGLSTCQTFCREFTGVLQPVWPHGE